METTDVTGTRKRRDHNTAAFYVLPFVPKGVTVEGDKLFTAPVSLANANGTFQYAGDQWLRLTKIDGVPVTEELWMAYIHKGEPICINFKIVGEPDPVPTEDKIISATLKYESGKVVELI
jgi:hypothetical protein